MTHAVTPQLILRPFLSDDQAAYLIRSGDLPLAERTRLAEQLRAQLRACAAYIPAPLVHARLADPTPGRISGAYWAGSLLFADMSGFTALSEKLSALGKQGAEELSAIINQLFSALIDELHACGGVLLKFGGDALTAFFAADSLGLLHAAAATRAALAMQQCMAAFAAIERRGGRFRLGLRVGVHSGSVFAAEVGDPSHIELVITGPEVNRVAMAQEIAAPGEVVISVQTARLLEAADLAERSAGFMHIRSLGDDLLAVPTHLPLPITSIADLGALELMAAQLAALQPYLVRNLPRRFLETAETGLGEFRPVTVLFANFHDFSALLSQFGADVDTAAQVLNAYYRRAQAVVHRYDGIINKVDMYTHGDKLMALFGAPTAHEDDPLRAARCALDLQAALDEANAEIITLIADCRMQNAEDSDNLQSTICNLQLHQKIGINTGTVFAGRVGGAQRYEYTVMGPAVNLAARLMAAAADGAIVLSPAAYAAISPQAVVEPLPPLSLKGLAAQVTPARLLGLSSPAGRLRASAGELARAPLIGRDHEIASLTSAAHLALSGAGRAVAIVGEAGSGKSRLVDELLQRLHEQAAPAFTLISADCQSYEQRTPYAATRGLLRRLLGLESSASAAQILAHTRQMAPELARFAPLIGDLLGIALPETALTETLSPQQRYERAQALAVRLFQAAATSAPLLLMIEDMHWSDASSLELFGHLAAALDPMPLLLVLTYRPDPPIVAPWEGLPNTAMVALTKLTPEGEAELLRQLLGGAAPPEILGLLERTQGNPFFIEELVRALVISQALARGPDGAWRLTQPLDQVAVPNSIEGLLLARLDRLAEPQHELVQVASVIGRRFEVPVLSEIYQNSLPLSTCLGQLSSAEMIDAESSVAQTAYLFRHAMLRDVAYEGILYARRRTLHRRVAQRIEALSGERHDEALALLGWHYSNAELWEQAFNYQLRAGELAQRRFANRDALGLLAAAQAIIPRLESLVDPSWLSARQVEIHERSGDLHALLGEYPLAEQRYRVALALLGDQPSADWLRLHRLLAAVDERRSNYEAAFAWLRDGMGRAADADQAELARCYLLGAGIYFRQGAYGEALTWARTGHTIAEQIGDLAVQAHALQLLGALGNDQGDFGASVPLLERACALFEQINHATGLSNALNNLGMAYLQLGRWRDTVRCYERSLEIGENVGDVQAMARTANNLAVVLVGRNELERAAELYGYSSEQFGKIGSLLGAAVTRYNRGEVLLLQDRPSEALPLFNQSIFALEQIGARNFLSEVLRLAAEANLALGDYPAAERYAQRALELANELGIAVEAAIAQRVLGQIALGCKDYALAAEQLAASAAALEKLDNRYELGKTRRWLARLAQAVGQFSQALELLRQAEQLFYELDAQRDLAQVRARLAELSG